MNFVFLDKPLSVPLPIALPTDFLPRLSLLGRYGTSTTFTKELTSNADNIPSNFIVHVQKIRNDNFDLFEMKEVVLSVTYTDGRRS